MEKLIKPARALRGSLRMPGDKSVSHRYAMLAAVARGASRFDNFATGQDCAATLRCVEQLGARLACNREGGTQIVPSPKPQDPSAPLDCGNSGSTMRMLAGLIAGREVSCEMVGDSSLMRRPMARIVAPLRQMGAEIESAADGKPPLRIGSAGHLRGIDFTPPTPSAQVKSSLLFAGLSADGTTTVREHFRTRDHGELALRAFGATVERTRDAVSITGPQELSALETYIPGDISSAAFFLCAAALFPDSDIALEAVGMNPTRSAILDALTSFGAKASVLHLEEAHGELMGSIRISAPTGITGGKISGAMTARLIDELPLLAAIAPYTKEGIEIRDAAELRVKESDRIAVTAGNLRRMGARVEEFEDGMRVAGNQRLHGAELDSHGDHRIAMAFAVAGLRAQGETLIRNADAVAVSFPEFWDFLDRVRQD